MIIHMECEVGGHLGFSGKVFPTIAAAIEDGMMTVQFFMGNPKSAWKRTLLTDDDIEASRALLRRFPMNVFSHFPYCANLAGRSKVGELAWSGNTAVDGSLTGVMEALELELATMARLRSGRSGVVIHPGSYPDRAIGHATVAHTLNRIKFAEDSVLLLENCAGEGNKLCRTFDEIRGVLDLVNEDQRKHVKVCVDTAHLWGQGDYDLSTVAGIDAMFEDFDRSLGISAFYLLHLNDSRVPMGSKKDAHACLGEGYIWGNGFGSLIRLMERCKEYGIPMVLETCDCRQDMATLFQLQKESTDVPKLKPKSA